jgi:hypothetical protein
MGRLDVRKMLAELTPEEFDHWRVAYHELHLDGARPAAIVAAALHNELMPLHAYFDLEWEPKTAEQMLPSVVFGDDDDVLDLAQRDAELDRMIQAAAAAYSSR